MIVRILQGKITDGNVQGGEQQSVDRDGDAVHGKTLEGNLLAGLLSKSDHHQVRGCAKQREVAAEAQRQSNTPPHEMLERDIPLKYGNRLHERHDDRNGNRGKRNVVDDGDRESADPHHRKDNQERMPGCREVEIASQFFHDASVVGAFDNDDSNFEVFKADKNTFIVQGGKIERLAQVTSDRNPEQIIRLQNIMKGMGIFDELAKRGIKDEDTVIVGHLEFVYFKDEIYG